MAEEVKGEQIREAVRERYAAAARQVKIVKKSGCCPGSASSSDCGCSSGLYSASEVAALPHEAVLASLGCGNPTLLAQLRPGETVLDLGSGGGIDVLLSARRVGPTGKAYGLDMTDEMLELARSNAAAAGVSNVEFLKGHIESIPLPDSSVDVIISNCVINLSADKDAVLKEAFRVLKPGGRFAVADIVVEGGPLPPAVRQAMALWAGCVAGALGDEEYRQKLTDAGFESVEMETLKVYGRDDVPEEAGKVLGSDLDLDPGTRIISAFIRAQKSGGGRVKQYFEEVAPKWDEMRKSYFTEEVRDAAIARANLTPESVVADVGTGTGFMLVGVAPLVSKAYGFDASSEMLEVARRNLGGASNVELRVSDGSSLPLPDGSLDAVFANMYLHHTPDPAAAIAEMVRVLKPGGRLAITDMDKHDHQWMREEMADVWLGFDRRELEGWLKAAGLADTVVDCTGSCCSGSSCGGDKVDISVFVASGTKRTIQAGCAG